MKPRVCVIGAGLAGGMVASQLAALGHSVVLVEQGETATPSVPADEEWAGADLMSLFTRGEGIGGSSNFWHGGLIVLDASDVEGESSPGGSSKYPISYAELCDYYSRALRLMTGAAISLADLLPGSQQDAALRLDDEVFRLKPMYFPTRPFSTKDMINEAKERNGLEVLSSFRVKKLILDDSSRVIAVEGAPEGSTGFTRVVADVFVLCAGGIGSPKILLSSARTSAALRDLPIGKFLIDHPTGFVFKAKLRKRRNLKSFFGRADGMPAGYRRRWGVVLKEEHLALSSHRNHVVYLRPAFGLRSPEEYGVLKKKLVAHRGTRVSLLDWLRVFKFTDLLAEALNFRYGIFSSVRFVSGFVFAEQKPGTESAIELTDEARFRVRWQIAADDSASLDEFLRCFLERHADVFEEVVMFPGLLGSGAHHSGGCRMANGPAEGVVDHRLQVFGVGNLFIADGSVLGHSGHANTGLTIAALALKCVDEVRRQVASAD